MARGLGIVYFEAGVPSIYPGDLESERDVLRWIKKAVEADDIEEVNEKMAEKAMMGQLGSKLKYGEHEDAAVLFCKFPHKQQIQIKFSVRKGDVYSAKVLKALENIDDECDENGIIFVKVSTAVL